MSTSTSSASASARHRRRHSSQVRRITRAAEDMTGVFTAQGWARFATSELLRASTAVDHVCHAVVAAKRRYARCDIADALRDEALTVAVVERSLFAYADRIRMHTLAASETHAQPARAAGRASANTKSRRPSSLIAPARHPSSRQSVDGGENEAGDDLKIDEEKVQVSAPISPDSGVSRKSSSESLASSATTPTTPPQSSASLVSEAKEDIVQEEPQEPQRYPWKHSGGVVSLLGMLARNLHDTRVCLRRLIRLSSLRTFVQYCRRLCLLWGVSWAAALSLFDYLLRRTLLGSWIGATSIADLLLRSRKTQWKLLLLIMVSLSFWLRWLQQRELRRLRRLHRDLSMLLRLWHICISVLDYGKSNSNESVANSRKGMPISRWMLELVPPSLKSAAWYQASWRLRLFVHGLNVLYASVNLWFSWTGVRWYGVPVAVCAAGVYAIRPELAARTSTELLASPDIRLAKASWAVYDKAATRYFAWTNMFLSSSLVVIRNIEFTAPSGRARKLMMLRSRHVSLGRSETTPLVLNLHGGGWMANVLASDMRYLSEWAIDSSAPIVSMDFALDPELTYPDAVAESFAAYNWILSGGLGFIPSTVVLVGDSAGGNLCVSVCMQAILSGRVKRPDALILAYPALNLRLAPTPSKFIHMMDPVVPMNLLHQCRSIYLPSHVDDLDLCVSPLSAPDRILKAFPPTSIMIGGLDPFLDDSIDFAHKLSAQQVFCQLKIYPQMPHAFLGFSAILPQARDAIRLAGKWIQSGIRRRTHPLNESISIRNRHQISHRH